MKQRIFSHFQDYLIQYISHHYQDLLYCNSSQYILSTYNSQHWRSLGLFSSEATRRAPEGEQMVGGSGACSPVIFLKIMGA